MSLCYGIVILMWCSQPEATTVSDFCELERKFQVPFTASEINGLSRRQKEVQTARRIQYECTCLPPEQRKIPEEHCRKR